MQLLDQVPTLDNKSRARRYRLTVTREDLDLIGSALQTVRRDIDPEEFQTRLGVEPAEADALLATLIRTRARGSAESSPESPNVAAEKPEPSDIVIAMTEDELLLVNNALNEALHGLTVQDAQPRLAKAEALLNAVGEILDAPAGTSSHRYVDHLR